ncbi:MAG: prolipoprotein diacylglyceryl transferase [Clostridia bacterium]|nr:prolipoprotein diacylglyceryl transferase [Clostridia bacterium]
MPASRFIFGTLPWYSVLVVSGMAVATILAAREGKRICLPKDTFLDLALFLLPCGVVGARLYYVLFSLEQYAANPISALYIWEGGLAIYGGLIAGVAVILIFARRRHLPLLTLLDCIAPGVALAQAIGRWGNFFNQEAYGVAVTNPAFQFFPVCVSVGGEWHLATFFYESAADACIFLWLWLRRKKRTHPGDTLLGYLLLYGSVRAAVEGLRTDSLYGLFAGLRVSQVLSILMVLAVCLVWAARVRRGLRLWLVLPAAALTAAVILAASGASLALRTAALLAWGLCAMVCVLIFQRQGGKPCPAES